jgi:hypothetical protein
MIRPVWGLIILTSNSLVAERDLGCSHTFLYQYYPLLFTNMVAAKEKFQLCLGIRISMRMIDRD